MVLLNRFTVVLDARTLFSTLVRNVLLTFANHGLLSPKWSPEIEQEWIRNLTWFSEVRCENGSSLNYYRLKPVGCFERKRPLRLKPSKPKRMMIRLKFHVNAR
jgi:hypothetical protein